MKWWMIILVSNRNVTNGTTDRNVNKSYSNQKRHSRGNYDHHSPTMVGVNHVNRLSIDHESSRINNDKTFKSPSDTTLYLPGLRKLSQDEDVIQKISNFVDSMKLDSGKSRHHNRGDRSLSPTGL